MKKKVYIIDQDLFLRRAYVNNRKSKTASFKGKKYRVHNHLIFDTKEEGVEYYRENKISIQMSSDDFIQKIIDKYGFKIKMTKISNDVIKFVNVRRDEFTMNNMGNWIQLRHFNGSKFGKTRTHEQRKFPNIYQMLDSINSHDNGLPIAI